MTFCNLLSAIAAPAAKFAFTKLASTIVDVTVFVSLFVIKFPVIFGRVNTLSEVVGSCTVNLVSNASTVEPSKTRLPVSVSYTHLRAHET